MTCWQLSKDVGNVRNDRPDLIDPVTVAQGYLPYDCDQRKFDEQPSGSKAAGWQITIPILVENRHCDRIDVLLKGVYVWHPVDVAAK